jgi:hypothetical protein
MKKRLLGVILAVIAVVLTVSVSSAADLPGANDYWIGATHQNVGDGPATVVVTAYDSLSNSTYPYTLDSLPAGASVNVGLQEFEESLSLPRGFIGSLVTTADQPLVALINVTNRPAGSNGDPYGTAAAIYSAIDGSNTSTSLLFPLVKHNHVGKTTTFYLQNAGIVPATITTAFKVNGVTYSYTSPSINPGQMVAVDPGMTKPNPVPNGDGNVGSMTATSTQPIAGMMLEHEHSATIGKVLQASNAFANPDELNQTVYCPTVKNHYFGRSTGLQIMNAHTTQQTITVTFVDSDGVERVSNDPDLNLMAPGTSTTILNDPILPYDPEDPEGSVTLVSAIITGATGKVVAVIANESQLPLPPGATQTSTTYNCRPDNEATTRLSYPSFKERWFGRTTAIQIQNVGDVTASVTLQFKANNGNTYTTNVQNINAGASSVFVCVSSNSGLWNGSTLPNITLSGLIVTSTADPPDVPQPIIAIANESSWAADSCQPNNGEGSFDKATANAFNLDP